VLNSCIIAVPTAFTPNNDGLNDFLYPLNAMKARDLEFKVFNRWGQLVFSTRNSHEKWDGKLNGMTQPTGVFVWYLKYTHSVTGQKVFQKGTTMLIR
jgi:gliding motility-associated-like protein